MQMPEPRYFIGMRKLVELDKPGFRSEKAIRFISGRSCFLPTT
jgi:hypothetical protein